MSLLRQSVWAISAAVTVTVARFALAAILTRRLSQSDFGQFAYAQWLIDLTFLICSFGVNAAATRYVAEYRDRPNALATIMRRWWPFAFGLPVLSSATVLLFAFVFQMHLSAHAFWCVCVWAFASGIWAMQTAVLSGLQRFDLVFFSNVVAAIVLLVGAALVPTNGADMHWFFAVMAASSALASLVGFAETRGLPRKSPESLDAGTWRGIRSYSLNMWATALLASLVWSRGEMPIVRAALGDAGVAQYFAALTLFGGAMQGVMLAVSAVAPKLTRLWGEGARGEALSLARKIMDVQLLFSGIVTLAIVGFSPFLLTLAFGVAYADSSNTLVVLCLALLATATACHNHLLQIATDARFNRNASLVALVLLIVLAYPLVGSFGTVGAACARAGAILLLSALALISVHRRWGRESFSLANIGWISLVVLLSVVLVNSSMISSIGWRFALVMVGSVWLMFFVRADDGSAVATQIYRRLSRGIFGAKPESETIQSSGS